MKTSEVAPFTFVPVLEEPHVPGRIPSMRTLGWFEKNDL